MKTIRDMRRAGVPLCALETSDPAESIRRAVGGLNGKADSLALMQWDFIRGLTGLNEKGRLAVGSVCEDVMQTLNPSECLALLEKSRMKDVLCFFHSGHELMTKPEAIQAVWNIRDAFKQVGSTLVLLAPSLTLPAMLAQDVVTISDPLPEREEIGKIVSSICSDAGIAQPAEMEKVSDILSGLSAFAVEQVTALSISKEGLNMGDLWERKKRMVEQTPGLQVWQGGDSFESLGGLENLKKFLGSILTSGKSSVNAIGFIDEIEKGLAGAGGDTSGTSQDQLQVFLKVMQDLDIPGMILVGPPGTGKSAIAKAAGNVAGIPVVAIDTGSMKGSLVGESERRIRAAMDVFKSISQGKGLFIATCNKIASLPPELRRRFTLGTFYVDLPGSEERAKIWDIWKQRYVLLGDIPEDEGWTGAEIRACCDVSFRTGLSLVEASSFIVPVSKSAADSIEALRKQANGKFISANTPGVYRMAMGESPVTRKVNLD